MSEELTDKQKRREANLKRRYGITLAQYQEILDYQGGVCPVCEREPGEDEVFNVDHDHTDKIVRGVVCTYCNLRILSNRRDGDKLIRAGEYINDPPAQHILPEGHKVPTKKKQPRKRDRRKKK